MHHRLVLLCLWLLPTLTATAQVTDEDWDEQMQQMAEQLATTDLDEADVEATLLTLAELREQPLDLNTATRSQLLALPFLTPAAADAIIQFRQQNGPFHSLAELRLLSALTDPQRQWLRLCATAVEPDASAAARDTNWWGRTRHEVLTRVDVPFYERAGWPWSRGVAGRVRYLVQQGRHLDAALSAEADAGEPRFNRDNRGLDSYSFSLRLQDAGPLQTLVLGDFKATFGLGLTINNSLRLDKLTSGLWHHRTAIRPHHTTDEVNFLRGVAATIALAPAWQVSAFYSRRSLDATVAADGTVSSISATGLHRTAGELNHRGTLKSQTSGLHIDWTPTLHHGPSPRVPLYLQLGASALYQHYDRLFRQPATLYRQILFEGYQMGALAADYHLSVSHLQLHGETARSFDERGGGWATLNTAAWSFSSATQLMLFQRFYSYRYLSPHSSAFGENSRNQNESGVAALLTVDHVGPIGLRLFFDYFYHPWARYTMSRSSDGWEGLVQATYHIRRGRDLILRYRVKSKEQSDRRHLSHQLRIAYPLPLSRRWTFQPVVLAHLYHEPASRSLDDGSTSSAAEDREASTSFGFTAAPRLDYATPDNRLRLSILAALFHSDDFNSRLHLYEPSLYQSFGLQQFYGRGQRLATTLRLRTPNRHWTLQAKLGITHFTDREAQSSGPLLINSPWRTDLQLLLRWQR